MFQNLSIPFLFVGALYVFFLDIIAFIGLIVLFLYLFIKVEDLILKKRYQKIIFGLIVWLLSRVIWQLIYLPNIGETDFDKISDLFFIVGLLMSIGAIGLLVFVLQLIQLSEQWAMNSKIRYLLLAYGITNLISSILVIIAVGIFIKVSLVPILGIFVFMWLFRNTENIIPIIPRNRGLN